MVASGTVRCVRGDTGTGRPFFLVFTARSVRIPHYPRGHFINGDRRNIHNSIAIRLSSYIHHVARTLRRTNLRGSTLIVFSDSGNPILSSNCESFTIQSGTARSPTNPFQTNGCDVLRKNSHVPFVIG